MMINLINISRIKKFIFISLVYLHSTILISYASGAGLLEGVGSSGKIRRGEIHIDDIPNVIKGLIDIFLSLAGTIAVIFVIIGAYKLLFGATKSDSTQGRETIIMALTGFALSALAWFIVRFIFDNLS